MLSIGGQGGTKNRKVYSKGYAKSPRNLWRLLKLDILQAWKCHGNEYKIYSHKTGRKWHDKQHNVVYDVKELITDKNMIISV